MQMQEPFYIKNSYSMIAGLSVLLCDVL